MTPRRRTEVLDGQRDAVTLCRCYTVILEFTPYPHQLAEIGKVCQKSRGPRYIVGIPTDARWGRYIRYEVRPLRFVDSSVYAVGGCIYAEPVYSRGGAYTHPLCIRTYRSRKRTHPRIRTHRRVQAHMRKRSVVGVYAPFCVYAPDAAYTPGRDERHAITGA